MHTEGIMSEPTEWKVYEVYHADNPNWGYGPQPTSWPAEGFTKVAVATGSNVDDAFRLTNHIDWPWWENEGVVRVGPECRSTSVGDVVVEVDCETGERRAYLCANCGWDDLPAAA